MRENKGQQKKAGATAQECSGELEKSVKEADNEATEKAYCDEQMTKMRAKSDDLMLTSSRSPQRSTRSRRPRRL
eukprot:10340990-Heterocapsa_arctica.AAC.1